MLCRVHTSKAAFRYYSVLADVSSDLLVSASFGHEVGGTCQITLIDSLVSNNVVRKGSSVENVLRKFDRSQYIDSPAHKHLAYQNRPVPIGKIATMSTPQQHAQVLSIMENYLRAGMSAMDFGCGSGYLTVCMAQLVGRRGRVLGIDIVQDLVRQSKENAKKTLDPSLHANISFLLNTKSIEDLKSEIGDQTFDCIHVGVAVKIEDDVRHFLKYLKPGGGLLIPVGLARTEQELLKIRKTDCGNGIEKESVLRVMCQPLLDTEFEREGCNGSARSLRSLAESRLKQWREAFEKEHNRPATRQDLYHDAVARDLFLTYQRKL